MLTVLAGGCGLLVGALCGRSIPGPLIPVAGFALIVVVGQFLTLADGAAELVAPVCVAIAVAGILLALPLGRLDRWAAVAALSVFAVYAAPIALSGEATFAGYIRLDDTATWMALTDRVMEHGRDLDGLAPSSYEATLAFNLADGYPSASSCRSVLGRALVGQDVAWLIQPYMAWLAAILALAVWSLAGALIASARLRALVAFVAAQSALLFGYYLWGGVKEVAAAALIASAAAMVAGVAGCGFAPGAVVVLAVISAALVGVLSAGGALWLVPALALAGALAVRRLPARTAVARAALLAGVVVALSVPVLATGGLLPPTSSPLTDAAARGNLLGPLELAQVAGIWPAGDFRLDPVELAPTYVLIAVASIAAVAGLVLAWRARAWGVLAYAATALGAGLLICLVGSPWVDGKALATASPAIPLAAALTAAWLLGRGRRVEGAVLLAALAGGILWSNALAYRDVNLAPRDQLVELQTIGERIAGQGPALMTEYQPYGVRHFLRRADPEGASELRRRRVPLVGGGTLRKGEAADTDALDPGGLLAYRTLVLRRSPAQSRPPAPYRLTWRGEHYEVWQRPAAPRPIWAALVSAATLSRSGFRTASGSRRSHPVPAPASGSPRRRDRRQSSSPSRRPSTRSSGRLRRPGRSRFPMERGRSRPRSACDGVATTRSGWAAAFGPGSSWRSTASRPEPFAIGSRTAASTSRSAARLSIPVRTWSRSSSAAPTCIRGAAARRAPSDRWCSPRPMPPMPRSSGSILPMLAASAAESGTGSSSRQRVGDSARRAALAATVGLVLADSSVVVLALPEIYRDLDVSVSAVVWVLVAFNLVLAVAAVPAAHAAGRIGPARLTTGGLMVFGAASLVCGLAPSIEVLLVARCAQAVGGAAAVCASLELMPAVYGSERSAARAWAAAGAAGAALGPGIGGLLTELISWESIFLAQVPVAMAAALPLVTEARAERPRGAVRERPGRPHLAANAALGLVSAALAAALFLVVLLLIEGWRLTPIAAAAAITVLPVCALLVAPLTRRVREVDARAAAGAILIAGGLAGLALLPEASVLLTLPPQALVGAGLALTLSALTEAALAGRSPQAIHGGWTIASRHAGVVVGLLVLTPIFTADLVTQRERAEQAGTAALLDARLPVGAKLDLAQRIAAQIEAEGDKVPIVGPAFDPLPEDAQERAATVSLRTAIEEEVDSAATHAFSASFLVAAAFALAALIPIAIARRRIEL